MTHSNTKPFCRNWYKSQILSTLAQYFGNKVTEITVQILKHLPKVCETSQIEMSWKPLHLHAMFCYITVFSYNLWSVMV